MNYIFAKPQPSARTPDYVTAKTRDELVKKSRAKNMFPVGIYKTFDEWCSREFDGVLVNLENLVYMQGLARIDKAFGDHMLCIRQTKQELERIVSRRRQVREGEEPQTALPIEQLEELVVFVLDNSHRYRRIFKMFQRLSKEDRIWWMTDRFANCKDVLDVTRVIEGH